MIAVVITVNSYKLLLQAAAESALGRGDRAGAARVDLDRLTQRACQPLETGFDDVVIILAVEILDVEGHAGRLRKGLEPLLEQFGVHLAELGPREIDPPDEVWAVRNIDADPGQRLVERDHRRAVALDAGAVAQGLRHRGADHIADILGRVVEVDVEIAFGLQGDVDQTVLSELVEHVVEKADAGRDLGRAGAVERDPALDLGLLGLALDRRDPHGLSPLGSRVPIKFPALWRLLTRTPRRRHSTGIIAGNDERPVHRG